MVHRLRLLDSEEVVLDEELLDAESRVPIRPLTIHTTIFRVDAFGVQGNICN